MNRELQKWGPTIIAVIVGLGGLFVYGSTGGGDPRPVGGNTGSGSTPTPEATVEATPEPTPTETPPIIIGEGGLSRPPNMVASVFAEASASAETITNSAGEVNSYGPENTIDTVHATAWCVPGDGVGQYLRLVFDQPVRIAAVTFIPGYDKIDPNTGEDRFKENRKIRAVRVSFPNAAPYEIALTGLLRQYHVITLPSVVETDSLWIEPLSTTQARSSERDYTCISEAGVILG